METIPYVSNSRTQPAFRMRAIAEAIAGLIVIGCGMILVGFASTF